MSENLEVAMATSFADLYDTVFGGAWKAEEVADAVTFRDTLAAYVAGANMLREKFDSDVWNGHSDGTVSLEITSIRKQREGDAPGKKAVELTAAEKLAKRLGK